MIRLPSEPMLAAATDNPAPPAGWAAEPKWDGFRGILAREINGSIRLRSRRGTDLSLAFPDLVTAAGSLPAELGDICLDGELVVWKDGRTDFGQLLQRMNRRPATVRTLAGQHPAHYIAFDLLHLGDRDLTSQPYRTRRAELEWIFADYALAGPWTLCPSTTDLTELAQWLTTWTKAGVEGACYKRLDQPYLAGRRAWRKYRVRNSVDAVIGAVTGTLSRPSTLLVGVYGDDGRLHFRGRTTPLTRRAAVEIGPFLHPAGAGHPWRGRNLSGIFDRGSESPPTLVEPGFIIEVAIDGIGDSYGCWRHPARYLRPRPDLA